MINESTGYAYVFGSNLYQGGPLFIDINDPLNPEKLEDMLTIPTPRCTDSKL